MRDFLNRNLPDSKYSDGKNSHCIIQLNASINMLTTGLSRDYSEMSVRPSPIST